MIPAVAIGVAAAAGVGAAVYAAYRPESQIYGATVVAGSDPRQVALTYDDGPNPEVTPYLLEVLARHNVRATFFLVGHFVKAQPELARQVAAAGHLIGNHTLTHPNLAITSARETRRQLAETNDLLEQTLGQKVRFFRAPFGARRPATLRIARELGLHAVQWNVAAQDWNPATPAQLLERMEQGIAKNQRKNRASNVLLHDGGHLGLGAKRMPTVDATGLLLEKNIRNLTFVTPENWV
ncbi:polysaccharide deacetylase family protein [Terriglobus tenax]|uniref:polysaccharide deacetylase family protein n=1 Tax=Terriglobus tenax TaxID=1111115 RepID=UPI0021DFFA55|nr:polysaccharide deacetylase family protein [Terriglobus tenax]